MPSPPQMQCHADAGSAALALAVATAPSSPTRHLCYGRDGGDEDGGDGGGGGGDHYFFFSAPASPVHYILHSPPASSASSVHYAPDADGDCCAAGGEDFEFAARHRGAGGGAGAATMSSAEELFLSGRIRVGCLSPIRQETTHGELDGDDDEEEEGGVHGHAPRHRRARSASPPRSPRLAKNPEPSDSFASASSSSSSSSSSTKAIRRRISLRDLLGRTCSDPTAGAAVVATGAERSGFWLPSIWPSRSKKALPCPVPQPGRRSTSSDKAAPAKRPPSCAGREEAPRRRTTSLPYRQGLVLGCLGFGARSYGLAKSMHPLSSR